MKFLFKTNWCGYRSFDRRTYIDLDQFFLFSDNYIGFPLVHDTPQGTHLVHTPEI